MLPCSGRPVFMPMYAHCPVITTTALQPQTTGQQVAATWGITPSVLRQHKSHALNRACSHRPARSAAKCRLTQPPVAAANRPPHGRQPRQTPVHRRRLGDHSSSSSSSPSSEARGSYSTSAGSASVPALTAASLRRASFASSSMPHSASACGRAGMGKRCIRPVKLQQLSTGKQ